MERILKKFFSISMCFFMCISVLQLPVYADEINEETPTVEEESNQTVEQEQSGTEEVEEEQPVEIETSTEALPGDASLLDYFLVEYPYLELGDTQSFVLRLKDGTSNVSSATLFYQKDGGSVARLDASVQDGYLFKFQKKFNEAGTYKVNKFQYVMNDQTYELVFSDMGMDVKFGVDVEYDGIEDLVSLDGSDTSTTEIPEVATIDSTNVATGETVIENTIDDSLESMPSVLSADTRQYTSSNPLVIAIDPGHGGSDSGTYTVNSRNDGLYEKHYTLKIANYLKAELEQYTNCKVIMTRTSDVYVDLRERCRSAASQGATVLVSIHLNGYNGTHTGAEVYYPSNNYRPDIGEEGKALAQKIQNELVGLGLGNRGIKVRYVYDENTGQPTHDPSFDYPDGSIGDYYGIIRHSKEYGMAGLIVEHCFADNYTDFNKFLNSEEKLRNLALADARGIINAYGLTKVDRNKIDALATENKSVLEDGIYNVQSIVDKDYVLQVANSSLENGTNITLNNFDGRDDQGWKVTHDAKGYVTFTNVNSGKALDVTNGMASNGIKLQQYTSNSTYAQKWIVKKNGSGYVIISALNSDYVLDLPAGIVENGRMVQLYQSNSTNAQTWTFTKFETMRSKLDALAVQNQSVLKNGIYSVHSAIDSNYVMEVENESLSNYANVQLYSSNTKDSQGWKVTHDAKGYVTFTNVKSGKVLDIADGRAEEGRNVQQYASNDSYAQKWIVKQDGSNYFIVSALDIDIVLNIDSSVAKNGQNIQINTSNSSLAQRWKFEVHKTQRERLDEMASANKSVLVDGNYDVVSAMNSSYVLDVMNGSSNNCANVQLYSSNASDAQAWKVTHDAKGYVTFTNEKSGKVLDIADGLAQNGRNVQQYASNGSYAQKWIVKKDGSAYVIVSALDSNIVLDLNAGVVKNGQNIQVYTYNSSSAQKWKFKVHKTQRDKLDEMAADNKSNLADGNYNIQSAIHSNYVIDVMNGTTNNCANVQLYSSNASDAQGWKVTHDAKGYVTFTNVKSGKVLDIADGIAQDGRNVQQYASNGSYAQKWIVKKVGSAYVIVSALDSNIVLDLSAGIVKNGQNIQVYTYNSTSAQKWKFEIYKTQREKLDEMAAANKSNLADGNYNIQSAIHSNYVIEVANGYTHNGANVHLYVNNGTDAQGWKVTHDAKGYVTFTNVKSGKVLDIADGIAQDGRNVQQYASNGSYAQKWIVKKVGSAYVIVSALDSNIVLDLSAGIVKNGQNIQVYTYNSSSAQKWKFDKFMTKAEKLDYLASTNASLMDDGLYYIKTKNVQFAIDVADGSKNNHANVQLYAFNKTDAQKWIVRHDSKGYVLLQNYGSGRYLTVNGSNAGNGMNVNQQDKNNSRNQKWIICRDDTGSLKIVSALDSMFVLDINAGKIQNGSNIQIYTSNNSSAQQWVFDQISNSTLEKVTPIMGASDTTISKMVALFMKNNANYDKFEKYGTKYDGSLAKGGASTIEEFCQIFYEEAAVEGVRVEVAFAQCMLETGYLKYGGDVKPDQYNFAGLGATGVVNGNGFANVRIGIRAQIQHLKAYASLENLVNSCVDPRFNFVKRGCAQYVEWLGQKENPNGYGWAVSARYGYKIKDIMDLL